MILVIFGILLAYIIGSIPTSYIFAKLIKGIDIRDVGSKNVGATNLSRVTTKRLALIALILDIVKGIVPVTLVAFLCNNEAINIDFFQYQLLLGIIAICGHIWPIFLNFKGGKGVATSVGVLLIVSPISLLVVAIIWFITVSVAKYVSLGSILAAVSLPIVAVLFGGSVEMVIFCITLCIIICYKHKSNIRRLIRNEEPKINEQV